MPFRIKCLICGELSFKQYSKISHAKKNHSVEIILPTLGLKEIKELKELLDTINDVDFSIPDNTGKFYRM